MSSFSASSLMQTKRGPPSGALVESQSVQSQFAALTKDRDHLRWQVECGDRQRRQQEGLLKELRDMEASLSQKMQAAHASKGAFLKQKALLEEEKMRLMATLKREKEELKATKLQELTEKQQQDKVAFLQAMDEWNQELDSLLTQAEDNEWKRLICEETIDMVPEVEMGDAKQLWKEAMNKMMQEEAIYNALEEERNQWRARLEGQSDLDLNVLERAWEQETSNDISATLFYGADGGEGISDSEANPAIMEDVPQESALHNEVAPVM